MNTGTVLVVGATGHVGHKVVTLLQRRGVRYEHWFVWFGCFKN